MKFFLVLLAFFPLVILGDSPQKDEFLGYSSQTYKSDTLKGLQTFTFFPQLSFPTKLSLLNKAHNTLVNELKKLGEVITLKLNDATGLGQGVFFSLSIDSAWNSNPSKFPIIMTSLTLSSDVTVKKTGAVGSAILWYCYTFAEGEIQERYEKSIVDSIQQVIAHFGEVYRRSNPKIEKKPTFYVYGP